MPALSRNHARLLSKVGNKPHATQADHHDALPTPPATNSTRSSGSQTKMTEDEEDIMRDPESSEDEKPARPAFQQALHVDGAQDARHQAPSFKGPRKSAPSPQKAKVAWKETPRVRSPESTRSKRSNESEEQGSSDNDAIFSSQGSSNKRLKSIAGNIHAPKRKPKAMYGKSSQRAQNTSQKAFKQPTKKEEKVEEVPAGPKFKTSAANDVFQFNGSRAEFQTPIDTIAGARNSLSPSLSSLSSVPDSPGVEEIKTFNLPVNPPPYVPTSTCNICGASVDKLVKERFQDEFTDGKAMNFKWQQRFCRHHKQESAREVWREKGYPDIDWSGLEKRMRRHDGHLRDVIYQRVESAWREDFRRASKSSASSTADAKDPKNTARAGYYGPRGEKAMTDHIIAALSDDLRQRASKDKLVAASGVKGGVSGFVHGVLVPELACKLIRKDLGVGGGKAREILEASVEVGVLVNPEGDEEVGGSGGGRGYEEEAG